MMKQIATFTVLKKIIIVFGVCIIPSISTVLAQSNNNQATTLLEIQALRDEVAQLRDMVERQQYEMQNLIDGLESREEKSTSKPSSSSTFGSASSINKSAPIPAQRNVAPGITNGNQGNATSAINSIGQSTPLNYQNGTGRLSVPTQNTVGATVRNSASNTITQNGGLNNVRQQGASVLGTPGVSAGNGAINASNIPTPTVRNNAVTNSTIGQSANTVIGNTSNSASRQAARVLTTTPAGSVTNSAKGITSSTLSNRTLPSTGTGIRPIETIQPGSSIPTSLGNSGQRQQGITSQVANLNTLSENDYYQQGFGLLKESKHNEAVTVFQKQIKQYPQGDLADDAYFWVAESLYVTRKLNDSKENFRAIIQNYSKSDRVPDAMLKLAYIEQEQGNIIESRILLQEIIQFHPQSDAALSAKNRLSQIN